ncbi:hypothetical protein B0O80DRAFT_440539 [Mortierella sp. GBAus27b]|nr:hypothetical protein BGX31_003626 [Mortierella sp. GBA43]KAI8359558.1 hypothetical protein B0O80DRAFT_440539 [Mortierella sp. GBAus27b]
MSPTFRPFGAAFLLLSTLLSSSIVSAQYKPSIVSSSSSAYIDGKGLYILGGTTTSDSAAVFATPKSFMMDLSVAWNINNPTFKQLADGPSAWNMPSAMSSDGKSWFSLVNGTANVFDVDGGKWSTPLQNDTKINSDIGFHGVTDPDSGIIYVPNGYTTKDGNAMLRVNLQAKTTDSVPMIVDLAPVNLYAVAWSSPKKKMIFYSGWADGLYSFSPSGKGSGSWKKESVKGDEPPPRVDACMVSAFGGNKMVVFGGFSRTTQKSLSDIYILDVNTMTWTKGPDSGATGQRDSASCASSKNYFIAWGGVVSNVEKDAMPNGSALVFDLQSSSWTDQYDGTSNRVVQEYKNVDPHTSMGAVLGGVLGTLVVLLAIMGFVIYRKRVAQRTKVQVDSEKQPPVDEDPSLFARFKTPSQFKNMMSKS